MVESAPESDGPVVLAAQFAALAKAFAASTGQSRAAVALWSGGVLTRLAEFGLVAAEELASRQLYIETLDQNVEPGLVVLRARDGAIPSSLQEVLAQLGQD